MRRVAQRRARPVAGKGPEHPSTNHNRPLPRLQRRYVFWLNWWRWRIRTWTWHGVGRAMNLRYRRKHAQG